MLNLVRLRQTFVGDNQNNCGGKHMKRALMLLAVFLLSSVWLVCSLGHAQEKVVSLKFANFFPPDNRISVVMDQWCKEIEKRTNGTVKITQFPGGYPDSSCPDIH
jgi:TRAP-type C4-dicarboxylate transport system substrate-binding protein